MFGRDYIKRFNEVVCYLDLLRERRECNGYIGSLLEVNFFFGCDFLKCCIIFGEFIK